MNNTGLVLEGGGMRGVYTAGILEYFSEQNLYLPYVIGVSAGACQASSYLSRQKGRNKQVTIDYVDHPDYLSFKNLFRKRQLFGMEFIFEEIPKKHVPFDYESFFNAKEKFFVGVTDCNTGEPIFYEKNELGDSFSLVLRASSSLPLMAPIVKYDGRELLDGGISDPLPLKKSEQDGNHKNIVVLTRNEGYRKKPAKFTWLLKRKYRNYDGLIQKVESRASVYNETLELIEQREREGNVFAFRPSIPLEVDRVERNKQKLTELYSLGYNDAKRLSGQLKEWLE